MMEAQNKSNNNGGEVRRLIHIVYFLSRNNGRIEHPHLIRLNHLSTNGVRLRDVKRWLGELRGKDMAESFAWSYKRKYKTGYLWQDLFDDDLITPISDNEYVLKGSEISSSTTTGKDKSNPMQKDQSEAAAKNRKESSDQTSIYNSTKSSPSNSSEEEEEEEQSPVFTSSTSANDDHSDNIDRTILTKKISSGTNATSQMMKRAEEKNSLDSPYVFVSDKIVNKKKDVKASTKTASSKPQTNNGSSKSMLRNLITCGRAVETNDSALVVMKKQPNNRHSNNGYRPALLNMCSGDVRNVHSAEVYGKREKKSAGGSDIALPNTIYRSQSTTASRMRCNEDNDSAKRNCEGRDISASYKPINGPTCSLCNKQFKPEKLHAHLISCKGRRKTMFKDASTNLSQHESSTQISVKEDFGSRYLL